MRDPKDGMDPGWRRVRLGDIARIASGGTPDRKRPEYWGGDIPWITTGQIDFNIITEAEERITASGLKNSSAKLFPRGSILLAMIGQGATRGKVAELGIDAAINQSCVAIVPEDWHSARFIYHALASRYEEIRDISNHGGQPNLNANLIREISLYLPTRPLQHHFATIADTWDLAITKVRGLIDVASRLKRGLCSSY
jgi:type I restriction enzyme S subunit